MVQVKRKDRESLESLMRRFSKKVQQSNVLYRAKKLRFYEPPKNKRAVREDAIRRAKNRAKRDYLRKIGKISPVGRFGRR